MDILAVENRPTKGDFSIPKQEVTVNLQWGKDSSLKAVAALLGTCLCELGIHWQHLGGQS